MENVVQLVACSLDGEEYAIDIRSVQEIIRVLEITRVPHAASCMSGVINLRGMVIPVIDIRKRFGLPLKAPGESSRIVIVNWEGLLVGILVDSVSEVMSLSGENIEDPPSSGSNIDIRYFTGIGKLDGRLLLMLDLEKVLDISADA